MRRAHLNLVGMPHVQQLRSVFYLSLAGRIAAGAAMVAAIAGAQTFAVWQYLSTFSRVQIEQREELEQRPEFVAAKELEQNLRNAKALGERAEAFFRSETRWYALAGTVLDAMPQGVLLQNLAFVLDDEEEKKPVAKINLSGTARLRGDVRALELALQELPGFVALDSPTQNIIPAKEVPFRMTVKLRIE